MAFFVGSIAILRDCFLYFRINYFVINNQLQRNLEVLLLIKFKQNKKIMIIGLTEVLVMDIY